MFTSYMRPTLAAIHLSIFRSIVVVLLLGIESYPSCAINWLTYIAVTFGRGSDGINYALESLDELSLPFEIRSDTSGGREITSSGNFVRITSQLVSDIAAPPLRFSAK